MNIMQRDLATICGVAGSRYSLRFIGGDHQGWYIFRNQDFIVCRFTVAEHHGKAGQLALVKLRALQKTEREVVSTMRELESV